MADRPGPLSIRSRLLVHLIGSLLLAIVAAAAFNYRIALDASDRAYDRSLLDPAIEIGRHLSPTVPTQLDLSPTAIDALMFDGQDEMVFQVRSADGAFALGDPGLPPPPSIEVGAHRFFDAVRNGSPLRVAALRTEGGQYVQVGETTGKRSRIVGEIMFAQLVPTALITAIAILLAWYGVTRGLQPLQGLRLELLRRSPADLRPLSLQGVPAEILPVKQAFNRLLADLEIAKSMQQRFLGNAAHQLRTPLAGLQMHLDLLLERELVPDIEDAVARMRTATERATRLATQLLALARAERTTVVAQSLQATDLATVAADAARDWGPVALDRRVDLGFDLESAPVMGDAALLREALDNLIDNALRYSDADATVTVRTGIAADQPCLCVEDSGPGIPAGERERVLERFYRIPGTLREGSGLGLAIVHEIAERHAASLSIETARTGRGTLVRIRFAGLAQPGPGDGGDGARRRRRPAAT